MSIIQQLFRTQQDYPSLSPNPLIHYGLVTVLLLLLAYCFFNYRKLCQRSKLTNFVTSLMLVDQLILYAWLIFSGVFDLAQHLPFYSCRLAIWLLLLGRFCGYKWAKKIGVWWGLFGSISALLVPDMYGYAFPHYTNFNFYIAHLGLGFLAVYEVFVNAYDFPRRDMRDISLALNLFCLITILVNSCLHAAGVDQANYAYLAAPPPPLVSLFHNWPKFAYMAFAVLAYNLMTVLEWILGRFCLYSLVRLRDKGKEKGI